MNLLYDLIHVEIEKTRRKAINQIVQRGATHSGNQLAASSQDPNQPQVHDAEKRGQA